MELHHRVELIDTLLEEAEQKMSALHHALGAQTRAKEEIAACRARHAPLARGGDLKV